MNINLRWLALFMLMLLMPAMTATAGEVIVSNDGTTRWQAGVDGVEIEWAPDGTIKRIYSRYSTSVKFADREGIAATASGR